MPLTPDYIVGFVDGEGTFSIVHGKPYFAISNNNKEILEEVRGELGIRGSFIVKAKGRRHPNYVLRANAFDDVKIIVKFFEEHPPLVKREAFQRFREAFYRWAEHFHPTCSRRRHRRDISEEVVRRMKELYEGGWRLKDIARELKVSEDAVSYYLYKRLKVGQRRCRRFTREELERLVELRRRGLTYREMAGILGRRWKKPDGLGDVARRAAKELGVSINSG